MTQRAYGNCEMPPTHAHVDNDLQTADGTTDVPLG